MSDINSKIMRRVRVVYFFRQSLSKSALRLYFLVGLLWLELSFVSIVQVMRNLQTVSDIQSAFWFTFSAITQTETVSLVILLAVATLVVFSVRDILKINKPISFLKLQA